MGRPIINSVDQHVGSRVRMRRLMLDMSQSTLANALGITFQQVQKYEKGTNRISASRMQEIGNILEVPAMFFFETTPGQGPLAQGAASISHVSEFISSRDGLALVSAFVKINDKRLRRLIVNIVEEIADDKHIN